MTVRQPLVNDTGRNRESHDDTVSVQQMIVGGGTSTWNTTFLIDETVSDTGFQWGFIMEGSYASTDSSVYGAWFNPTLNPGNFDNIRVVDMTGTVVAETGETVLSATGLNVGAMSKSGSGNVTTAYGLYVAEQGIGETNWSIYVAGGDCYFGGDITANNATLNTVNNVDYVQFDTTYADGVSEGRLQWNVDDGTLEVGMPGGNVNLQIGQETIVRCRNETGSTINNGTPVRITGASGNKPLIAPASANSISTTFVYGVATEDIDHNSNGYVSVQGLVRDIDTSSWNEGDRLYLDETGGLTRPAPNWPNFKIYVARVLRSHATEGIIDVLIDINPWLGACHDVDTTNVADGSLLTYNSTNNNWVAGDGTDPVPQYSHLKTGWDDSAWQNLNLTLNTANYTATLSASADTDYWIEGVKHTFSANTSKVATLNNTEGPKYLILDSSDTLVFSDTAWDIHPNYPSTRNEVTVAAGYWSVAQGDMITRAIEFHGHNFPTKLHEYLHETFGTRWASGLGVSTPDDLVLNVAEGEIYDEDIEINIVDGVGPVNPPPPWFQQPLTPLDTWTLYRDGASGNWLSQNTATTPVILDTNIPQVNTWNGTAWNLVDVGVNKYYVYWVFASSDRRHPVYLIPGQADGGTISEAEENNALGDLDLANLPTAEHKAIAKIIMLRKSSSPYYSIEQIDDYRFDVDSASGVSSASDHGALSGLADDDHTQYSLVDGTRAFTGTVGGVTPTANEHLTTKLYVDNTISTGYVPYTGATQELALGTQNLTANVIYDFTALIGGTATLSTISGTYLSIDNIVINDNSITSNTGTVNFSNDHIVTTGNVSADKVYVGDSAPTFTPTFAIKDTVSASAPTLVATLEGTYETSVGNVFGIWTNYTLTPADGFNVQGITPSLHVAPASGETVNEAYAMSVTTITNDGAGTVNTAYGLKLAAQSVGTVDNWSLYCEGDAYFGANIVMGSYTLSAPTADNQLLQATGADAASWTTNIQGLTRLEVDDFVFDTRTMTVSNGTFSKTINGGVTYAQYDNVASSGASTQYGTYSVITLAPGSGQQARGRETRISADTTAGKLLWAIGEYMYITDTGGNGATNAAAYYIPEYSFADNNYAIWCHNDIVIDRSTAGLILGPDQNGRVYHNGGHLYLEPNYNDTGATVYFNDCDTTLEYGYVHNMGQYSVGEEVTNRLAFVANRSDGSGGIYDFFARPRGTNDGTDYNYLYVWAKDTGGTEYMRWGYFIDGTDRYAFQTIGTSYDVYFNLNSNDVLQLKKEGDEVKVTAAAIFTNDAGAGIQCQGYDSSAWSGTQTGTMKIRFGWAISNVMSHVIIRGFNYSGDNEGPWSIRVGGYDYSSGPAWYAQSCSVEGNPPFQSVRVAFEYGYPVILLGNEGTVWNYPFVFVESVTAPDNFGAGDIDDGFSWTFDISDDEATDWPTITGEEACPMWAGPGMEIKDNGDGTTNWELNGDSLSVGGSELTKLLSEDKTIYLRTTGSDSNGGYSSDDAFLTPNRALVELYRWVADGYFITIDIGEGTFNCGAALAPSYAYGANVTWSGNCSEYTTAGAISNIGSDTALSTGLSYIDFDITLPAGHGASAGMFVIIKTVSGGTKNYLTKGCHEIQSVSANTATVRCVRRSGITHVPSGSITATAYTLVRSVFNFSASNGIKVNGAYHCGTWDCLVFKGSISYNGVWLLDGASIGLQDNFGTSGWDINLYAQNNASIFADSSVHSYSDSYIISINGGGTISIRYGAILSGARTYGIRAFNGSVANAYQIELYTAGATYNMLAYKGGFIDAENSLVYGTYASGTAFYVTSGGGIDSSGTTTDASTTRATEAAPGGNGAYHAY